eukprot:4337711-Pyramimonas_sp.AAC.1
MTETKRWRVTRVFWKRNGGMEDWIIRRRNPVVHVGCGPASRDRPGHRLVELVVVGHRVLAEGEENMFEVRRRRSRTRTRRSTTLERPRVAVR